MISQFIGTHIDYFRSWNQFETQIDKSELLSVTKLSYLKEMVVPRVRLLIEGLPWNTERYKQPKKILPSKLENQVKLRMLIFKIFYHYQ